MADSKDKKKLITSLVSKQVNLRALPGFWVVVKQARGHEILSRAQFLKGIRYVWSENGDVRKESDIRREEVVREEMWLTFCDSNMAWEEDEKELAQGISRDEFYELWGRLPWDVIEEWYQVVLELNPNWNPFPEMGLGES